MKGLTMIVTLRSGSVILDGLKELNPHASYCRAPEKEIYQA
jgi:hypothetical protein